MGNGESMLKLRNGTELSFSFKNNGYEDGLDIRFDKILRVPDGETLNARPVSWERFPLELVDDHKTRIPAEMSKRGGVMLPLYPFEALAISCSGGHPLPFAVKIGAGKINVLSGEAWTENLQASQQDYIVIDGYADLDGFYVDRGLCRQFVAVPLGHGASAEEQVTGTGGVGGIQIAVYPMRAELAVTKLEEHRRRWPESQFGGHEMRMGLGMSGRLDQKLFTDPFGITTWDHQSRLRCFVHLVASENWPDLTGKRAPYSPITARHYQVAKLPLAPTYRHYRISRAGSKLLNGLKTVGQTMLASSSGTAKDLRNDEDALRDIQPGSKDLGRLN